MSSVVTITTVLLLLVIVCLALLFVHNRDGKEKSGLLLQHFKKLAAENKLLVSVSDKLNNTMLGIDYGNNKMIVHGHPSETIINLLDVKKCRKQKKWIHLPAGKNNKPETHLEKIVLTCEFKEDRLPAELVFYEYRSNSVFQLHELEQKADYWELLINRQIKKPC